MLRAALVLGVLLVTLLSLVSDGELELVVRRELPRTGRTAIRWFRAAGLPQLCELARAGAGIAAASVGTAAAVTVTVAIAFAAAASNTAASAAAASRRRRAGSRAHADVFAGGETLGAAVAGGERRPAPPALQREARAPAVRVRAAGRRRVG